MVKQNVKWRRSMRKRLNQMTKNRKKGFSMVELIIVLAIMAILVALIGTQLIPYLERSRATRDYDAMDSLYKAYNTVLAESDDPTKVTLNDPEVMKLVGMKSLDEFVKSLKSSQFKGTTIKCFCNTDKATGQIKQYGICAKGQNGYTGAQLDSSSTKCKLGIKGDAGDYVTDNGDTFPLTVQ